MRIFLDFQFVTVVDAVLILSLERQINRVTDEASGIDFVYSTSLWRKPPWVLAFISTSFEP